MQNFLEMINFQFLDVFFYALFFFQQQQKRAIIILKINLILSLFDLQVKIMQ